MRLCLTKWAFVLLCIFYPLAANAAQDLRSLETKGPLKRAAAGQIASNVWDGLSRADALLLINALPTNYASPIYFNLARDLLLSDAPAFGDLGEGTRPDILIARLDKLLAMGALSDAQALYNSVLDDIPDNFDLAFRGLEISMLNGQPSAACLDLQAMSAQHAKNPKFKELDRFCELSLTRGADHANLLKKSKFKQFPALGRYLHGRRFKLNDAKNPQKLAFAVATGQVNAASVRLLSARAAKMPPLLLSVLLNLDSARGAPQLTCLAIEGARRGLASTRDLINLYEKPHYDADLLLDATGQTAPPAGLHPCMAPTVLYQRIASNKDQPARDITIRAALDAMASLPDSAFWPMALYFKDFDIHAAQNKKYAWRVARILAYEKNELPEIWYSGWNNKDGAGLSPFWPIGAIFKNENEIVKKITAWRKNWPNQSRHMPRHDPMIGLLRSGVLHKTVEKANLTLSDYENKFSLTFSRTYAIPSFGLTQRLANVIEKEQTGSSVALLLIGYGAIPPDQVFPHQMALVVDALNKASLSHYAKRFALEVLQ